MLRYICQDVGAEGTLMQDKVKQKLKTHLLADAQSRNKQSLQNGNQNHKAEI